MANKVNFIRKLVRLKLADRAPGGSAPDGPKSKQHAQSDGDYGCELRSLLEARIWHNDLKALEGAFRGDHGADEAFLPEFVQTAIVPVHFLD